jgi:hypothetical protein
MLVSAPIVTRALKAGNLIRGRLGTDPFFGGKTHSTQQAPAEDMDLSPSAARGGQSPVNAHLLRQRLLIQGFAGPADHVGSPGLVAIEFDDRLVDCSCLLGFDRAQRVGRVQTFAE